VPKIQDYDHDLLGIDFFPSYFFFGTGIKTQGLELAHHVLHHFCYTSSPLML
jgi:hypothetical protein